MSSGNQLAPQPREGMLRQQHFTRSIRHEYEEADSRKPRGKVRQNIDRRDISPMKILDRDHYRSESRCLFQEPGQLAHQTLRAAGPAHFRHVGVRTMTV